MRKNKLYWQKKWDRQIKEWQAECVETVVGIASYLAIGKKGLSEKQIVGLQKLMEMFFRTDKLLDDITQCETRARALRLLRKIPVGEK